MHTLYILRVTLYLNIITLNICSGKQNGDADLVTGCVFDTHFAWLYFLAAATDITNAVLFLGLFVLPLKKLIANQAKEVKQDVINMIKINIMNTTICMISSVLLLLILGLSLTVHGIMDWVWFGGGIDIIINCVSTFLMVKMNRDYIKHLLGCCSCKSASKKLAEMGIEYANKDGTQMDSTTGTDGTITNGSGMVLHLHDWDADGIEPIETKTCTTIKSAPSTSSAVTAQATPVSTTISGKEAGITIINPFDHDETPVGAEDVVEIKMDAECVEVAMIDLEK